MIDINKGLVVKVHSIEYWIELQVSVKIILNISFYTKKLKKKKSKQMIKNN